MKHEDFVPQDEGNLSGWADNLGTQSGAAANRTALGWSAATGTNVGNAAANIVSAVSAKDAARQAFISANAAQDAIITASLGVIRPAVADGKDEPTATTAILQLMGLIGTEITFDPETFIPPFRELSLAGPVQVRVKFGKGRGVIGGVKIYRRLVGTAGWTLAGYATTSPWIDTAPLAVPGVPEVREYRIRGVVKDVEIGLFSDVKTITVS